MNPSTAPLISPLSNPPLEPSQTPPLPTTSPPPTPGVEPVLPSAPVTPVSNQAVLLPEPNPQTVLSVQGPSLLDKLKKIHFPSWAYWLVLFLSLVLFLLGCIWLITRIFSPIRIKDQPLESRIRVDKLRVNTNGFLVLRAQLDEPPGIVIAQTGLLIPDTYQNFYLGIDSGVSLPPESLAQVVAGTVIRAIYYKDANSDANYNPNVDTEIVREIFGKEVQSTFTIKP